MFGIVVTYPTTLTTWFDEDGDVVVIKPDEVAAYTIDPVAVVYEELTAYPLTNNPFTVGDVPVAIPNIPVLLPVESAFASDHVLDELRKYNCPVVSVPDPNLTISPLNAGDVGGANINEPLRVCIPVISTVFAAKSPFINGVPEPDAIYNLLLSSVDVEGPAPNPIATLFEELPENKHPAFLPNAMLLDPIDEEIKALHPIAVLWHPVVLQNKALSPIAVL